ncbi:MAG: DUF2073 domain-containing protein [Candidatus Aenigmarchaeota archaeon]|nr:DUF2073 domain-containing protein [Candidatus Aenigmarchaeota archaeon]
MHVKIKFLPYKNVLDLKKGNIEWKLLKELKDNNILVINEQLTPSEQSILISEIMKTISSNFSGIEIACLDVEKDGGLLKKIQKHLIRFISGKRSGMTIIGPSNIVKKIKKNPEDLILYIT